MKQPMYGRGFALLRLAGLFAMLLAAWADGCLRRPRSFAQRARWAQGWSLRILRYLRYDVRLRGVVPDRGLVAANHISYVDVLVLGALTPCIFVAKSEVRRWPLIGALFRRGGVIFLERGSARAAAQVNRTVQQALREGVTVVVFPEGTTSSGAGFLPLHAAMFQAPLNADVPILPAWISYPNAGQRERIAYYGDATLMPHLLALMQLSAVEVCVHIRTTGIPARHRTQAAQMCEGVWRQMQESESVRRQQVAAA